LARLIPLWLSLDALAVRVRHARSLALATDFDGTLTPIVERPEQAGLPPRALRALRRLARSPRVAVAVISGRALDDLRERVGLAGVHLAGAAGLETLEPGGRRRLHVPPGAGLPPGLRATLAEWCARFPGAWLEDKRHAYALHDRAVPERYRPAFGAGIRRRLRGLADRVTLVHGKRVFEVLPAVRWDKGAALERWLRPRRGALAFYFGDDAHDEPAFESVRRRDGIAVMVGGRRSGAQYALPGPEQTVWFLEWLAREWREATRDER
jgi:trehalose-phosphatase